MSRQRVMIVDDSPTELKLLGVTLREAGFDVLLESDAKRAIDAAKRDQPNLILMDVVMPGLNGFQATRTLKRDAQTAGIPIIVVSSKAQETDRLWALRQGAAEYLVKPVLADNLLQTVKRVLDAA